MKKVLPIAGAWALLLLVACGSPQPTESPTPGAPTVAPAAEAPSSTPAPSQTTIDQAATSTQESVDSATDAGDASLERLAAMPENAQLPGGRWKSGVHYKPIVPAQTTTADPGQVEVLEVFWLGCAHCYALEPFLSNWKKSKADYVKFVTSPVMWGPAHRAHGRLYYTLQVLGKGEALTQKAFDEIHKNGNILVANNDAQSQKMHLAFARANGVSEADFTREYNGFAVNTKLQQAEEITRRYRVEGVPVVIVNGKYQTDVAMAGGQNELIQLINDLAAFEKRR